jgi:hypothetical protein
MAYSVFLMDPLSAMTPTLALQTMLRLQDFFDKVSARVPAAGGIRVVAPPVTSISPKDNELVVYVLPEGITIADKLPKETNAPFEPRTSPLITHHWGLTRFNSNGAISEVYVRFNDADMIAKLAFHECMHNKLRLSSAQLHLPAFPNCDNGLQCERLNPSSTLTNGNIAAMAGALLNKAPQWTGVYPFLVTARAQKAAGDSMWDSQMQW